jgi:hypothetical protein
LEITFGIPKFYPSPLRVGKQVSGVRVVCESLSNLPIDIIKLLIRRLKGRCRTCGHGALVSRIDTPIIGEG